MKAIAMLVLMLHGCVVFAQDENEVGSFHRLTLSLAHAHIPEVILDSGEKHWLALASWGLDYDFWFSAKWAVGLHSDVVLGNYKVETDQDKLILARSYPFASAIMGLYAPTDHLKLMLGVGAEFDREESLYLGRATVEYGWEIPKDWEISIGLTNDFKLNEYDSWVLAVGISKIFRNNKKG